MDPIHYEQLPQDNGFLPAGRWLIKLRDHVTDAFAGVRFVGGISVEPIEGRLVKRFVTLMPVIGAYRVEGDSCELGDCSGLKPGAVETEHEAAIKALHAAVAEKYGDDAAREFMSAKADELAAVPASDLMELCEHVPEPGTHGSETIDGGKSAAAAKEEVERIAAEQAREAEAAAEAARAAAAAEAAAEAKRQAEQAEAAELARLEAEIAAEEAAKAQAGSAATDPAPAPDTDPTKQHGKSKRK